MAETANDVIKRYLVDAIAAEKSFESQLNTFAKEGDNQQAKTLFAQHAEETRSQYERLTSRLEALGGSTSTAKSILAHLFASAPKSASIGHEKEERTSQDLMIAYSVENSEVAMYESLATAAQAAGDAVTERLARQIQSEERATAERVWSLIAPVARDAFYRVTGGSASSASATF